MMRYCQDPSHLNPDDTMSPWILKDESDHVHEKPRMRLVDGEWQPIDELIRAGMRELSK
jgi:hypothetical protein